MDKNSFFKIRSYAADNSVNIEIYGDIVGDSFSKWQEEDVCPIDVRNVLAEAGGRDLNIHINSCGGSVVAGYAIGNTLKNYSGKKRCFIDGAAASMAAYIAICCDEIYMPANSYLMVHKPIADIKGNANVLNQRIKIMDGMQAGMVSTFLAKAKDGVTEEQINGFMNANNGDGTWFTGVEAAQYFDITVTDSIKVVAYIGESFRDCRNLPEKLVSKISKDLENKKVQCRCSLELLKMKGV